MSEHGLGDPLLQHEARINGPSLVTVGNGYGSRSSSLSRNGGPRWKPSVFDFKTDRSGSTCPTCQGAGRVPKGACVRDASLLPGFTENVH